MISAAEKKYIQDGIQQNFRVDGRSTTDIREFSVEEAVIPSAFGSCRLFNDDIDLICAVKCDISTPLGPHKDQGEVTIDIEFSPALTGDMEANDVEKMQNEVNERAHLLIINNNILDRSKLCISKDHFAWKVSIDVLISSMNGSVLDVLSIAIRKALLQIRLPRLQVHKDMRSVMRGEEDADDEVPPKLVLADKEGISVDEGVLLPDVHNVPLVVSSAYVCGKIVFDSTKTEEDCADSMVSLSLSASGDCVGMVKWGSCPIEMSLLPKIMQKSGAIHGNTLKKYFA